MTDEACTFDEQKRRLDTCKGCDMFRMDDNGMTTCDACACSLSLLITFMEQSCPMGKW